MDFRLWPQDLRGSQAWAKALERAGVLRPEESAALEEGLEAVGARLAGGEGSEADEEDIHTLVERLLQEVLVYQVHQCCERCVWIAFRLLCNLL